MGAVVLGDDDAAGGVLVEAVNDAGAGLSADAGEVVAVMKEGVDEGAVGVTRGGVDDEAGGLVDDEDVRVLVEDVEGDVLGGDLDGDSLRDGKEDGVARLEDGAGFGGLAIKRGVAGLDEVLEAGAGVLRQAGVEEAVQALTGVLGQVGFEFVVGHGR